MGIGEKEHFRKAFWTVASELVVERESLNTLFPHIQTAFLNIDHKAMKEAVGRFLPEGSWRWPAYEAFSMPIAQECYKEDLRFYKKANIADLVSCLGIAELRKLYKEFAGDKAKSPGRKWAEVVNALLDILTQPQKHELAERLRSQGIAELELPGTPDYKEMIVLLCRRITMIAYNNKHKAELLEIVEQYPMWEFVCVDDQHTPKECKRLNGKRFRHDDPIWDSMLPCGNIECRCRITLA